MPTEPTSPILRTVTEGGIRFLIADNPRHVGGGAGSHPAG